jgi:hypothetical protein
MRVKNVLEKKYRSRAQYFTTKLVVRPICRVLRGCSDVIHYSMNACMQIRIVFALVAHQRLLEGRAHIADSLLGLLGLAAKGHPKEWRRIEVDLNIKTLENSSRFLKIHFDAKAERFVCRQA